MRLLPRFELCSANFPPGFGAKERESGAVPASIVRCSRTFTFPNAETGRIRIENARVTRSFRGSLLERERRREKAPLATRAKEIPIPRNTTEGSFLSFAASAKRIPGRARASGVGSVFL